MTVVPSRGFGNSLILFESLLSEKFPFFGTAVVQGRATFGETWERRFDQMLGLVFPTDAQLLAAVQGYCEFALDAIRLQKKFEKSREYIHKSYSETLNAVYMNENYMNNLYLPGILISHYLWPHHYRQNLFFENFFLNDMKIKKIIDFVEVGVGTGFYSRLILDALRDSHGAGFDISPTAKRFTERQISAFGHRERHSVKLADIVASTTGTQTQRIVSVEVLEHLEDPVTFLRALRAMLVKDGTGRGFITAALNAPNADHIYLYRDPAQVVAQLELAGFTIEQYFFAAAYRRPGPGVPVPELAAFIVS